MAMKSRCSCDGKGRCDYCMGQKRARHARGKMMGDAKGNSAAIERLKQYSARKKG